MRLVLASEVVRVFSFRQAHTLDVNASLKQQFAILERSLDACRVGIIYHHHLLGEARDEPDLFVGECRATARDDVLNTHSMERKHVKLTFNQIHEAFLANGFACLIEPEQVLTFCE